MGQRIRVTGNDGAPVPEAMVCLKPLPQGSPQVMLTDRKGLAVFGTDLGKVQLTVSHVSYEDRVDTLESLRGDVEIVMVPRQIRLGEVVVTSEYRPRLSGESMHPVAVIGKNEIDTRAASSLEEVLAQELNVRVTPDQVLGSAVTMNGMGGENIKFLVDGVPVIGRLDGNIDPGQLNLSQVTRVEWINGPMAAAYGTDAAGGVVNLITRKSVDGRGQSGVNLLYESIGRYNADAFAGFNKGRSSVMVSGGRNFFDGWSQPDTGRWQEWKPKEQLFANIGYRYTGKKTVWGYNASGFHEMISNKGAPRVSPYFAYAFDERYKTERITNQLTLSWLPAPSWVVSGHAAYSWYRRTKNTYRKDLVTLEEQLIETDSLQLNTLTSLQDTTMLNTLSGRAAVSYDPIRGRISAQAGIDLSYDEASGTRFRDAGDYSTGDYAFFASAEYRAVPRLTISPAVRIAYNTDFTAPVVPSLSLKYSAGTHFTVRASYGMGFRAPGMKERYLYFVDINHNIHGNENLRPERSHNFYVSAENKMQTGKISHALTLSLFYNQVTDLITLAQPDPDASLYTYINLGKFASHGASLNHTVGFGNLSLTTGVSVTGRYNIYSDSGNFEKYLYSPDLLVRPQYHFKKAGLVASVYFKWNGKLPGYRLNDDGTISQFSNDGYRFLDATLRKGFFKKSLFVTTGMKNMLNVTRVQAVVPTSAHSSQGNEMSLATGRTFFVKLQYTLGR